jgi:ubiquinol-cytochrome c reductase iron-sulfur subunit
VLAGAAVAAALAVPLASLGPVVNLAALTRTPWRRDRRLVDEQGRPIRAADIAQDAIYTAFPEGADRETIGAPIVLVRLPASSLALPQADRRYDADGILAFSKICTHAGCAISLYRAPLFPQGEPKAGLVCPCHYSIFDPRTGGTVVSGPAGRKLPMLPLRIDRRGHLRAAGTFDGALGPSWLEVRERKAST